MTERCAVCLSRDGFQCTKHGYGSYDASIFDCAVCGTFLVSRNALEENLSETGREMTPVRRATLSHYIRRQAAAINPENMWTTDRLDQFFASNPALPSPAQQAINILRVIGDVVSFTGEPLELLPHSFAAEIGSASYGFAVRLLLELKNRGLIAAYSQDSGGNFPHVQDAILTLAGWEQYEQEKQGHIAGNYGFIALKFGDDILDPLLRNHIKPAALELGYQLYDMRDVSRAGVIDNLIRVQIRDAAFVLVDLTHENAGAYWEAGYAEGLGKPVLYLCEKQKFDEKKTHFDTNHCTTILWDTTNVDYFKSDLIATLRRSLNI